MPGRTCKTPPYRIRQCTERGTDFRSAGPRNRRYSVSCAVVDHRVCQTPHSQGRSPANSRVADRMSCKELGVVRLAVASHATALAPFSQNSNDEVCFGSGRRSPGNRTRAAVHAKETASSLRYPSAADGILRQLSERPPAPALVVIDTHNIVFAHGTLHRRGNILAETCFPIDR